MTFSSGRSPAAAARYEGGNGTLLVGVVHEEGRVAGRIAEALESYGYRPRFIPPRGRQPESRPSHAPDVVVVGLAQDAREPTGIEELRQSFPDAHLVACMQPARMGVLRRAIDDGIDGIVWEADVERTLGPTIEAVRAGQLAMPRDAHPRSTTRELTNREKQCLSLVVMGMTNREIAAKLFISESTVKSHLNSSYRKLGVHSRAEAQRLIADPSEGLGTGILAITGPGLALGLKRGPDSRD